MSSKLRGECSEWRKQPPKTREVRIESLGPVHESIGRVADRLAREMTPAALMKRFEQAVNKK